MPIRPKGCLVPKTTRPPEIRGRCCTLAPPERREKMYRLESQMNITISNYKSLRRLITDWEHLTTFQKQTCVTRLLQYYRTRGRRSDIFGTLSTFANHKSWELKAKDNAEVDAIGPGNAVHGSSSSKNFISSIAKVGGAGVAGYAAARVLGRLR